MKKKNKAILSFIVLLSLLMTSLAGFSQFEDEVFMQPEPVRSGFYIQDFYGKKPAVKSYFSVVKKYFRVSPFEDRFAKFLQAILTDPELDNKEIIQTSDTSLFSLKGDYHNFNPFSVLAKKTSVKLAQTQIFDDKKKPVDTIYAYQLTAFIDSSKEALNLVTKEVKKLHKDLSRYFGQRQIIPLKGYQNISDGELTNYFMTGGQIAPVTLSWQTLSPKSLAVTIVLRLKPVMGYAFPPV